MCIHIIYIFTRLFEITFDFSLTTLLSYLYFKLVCVDLSESLSSLGKQVVLVRLDRFTPFSKTAKVSSLQDFFKPTCKYLSTKTEYQYVQVFYKCTSNIHIIEKHKSPQQKSNIFIFLDAKMTDEL